ncbi:hypothetical protein [Psychrobacillus sp. FSL H8-0487]|uniref:hypothetical protein n=1 Tax=Psychrobacillus sp. FSL H8-0487 TaxID=2921391 RepID=UPI0030F75026
MINVYDNENSIIARVNYNNLLDYWDGRNYSNGGIGMHLGITKLRNLDKYVLIKGTEWSGQQQQAYIVSDEEALQEILESNNTELLDKGKFKRLKDLYDSTLDVEVEE